MATSQDILDRAYQIVSSHEIARGFYALDANGEFIETASPDAVAFCSAGAIHRAVVELGLDYLHADADIYSEALARFFAHVQMNYEARSINEWNDRTPDEEIIDMFRRISNPLAVA